jgi:hypothetical protein
MRREVFRCLGGLPSVPLMEDYDFVKLVHQHHIPKSALMPMSGEDYMTAAQQQKSGTCKWNEGETLYAHPPTKGVCILSAKVKTSARRWKHNGLVLNTLVNQVTNAQLATRMRYYHGLQTINLTSVRIHDAMILIYRSIDQLIN